MKIRTHKATSDPRQLLGDSGPDEGNRQRPTDYYVFQNEDGSLNNFKKLTGNIHHMRAESMPVADKNLERRISPRGVASERGRNPYDNVGGGSSHSPDSRDKQTGD
jgi:hypothetical protein